MTIRIIKVLFHLLLILLFVGLEENFFSSKFFLNPIVGLIIFFALDKNKIYVIWPLLAGALLDFFSIFNFPIFIFSFLVTFFAVKFFSDKILIFKNFVSSVIFSVGGIILYNFIFLFFNLLSYFLGIDNFWLIFNSQYLLHILINISFTFLLLVIFYKKYERSILY